MAITVKHKFVSAKPDGPDPTQINPSNWNDEHEVTGETAVSSFLPRAFTGAIDGTNAAYVVAFVLTTIMVFRNGMLQAVTTDYTSVTSPGPPTTTITFGIPPSVGDTIQIWGS